MIKKYLKKVQLHHVCLALIGECENGILNAIHLLDLYTDGESSTR